MAAEQHAQGRDASELLPGIVVALALATGFVGLSAWREGVTYHLFPAAVAAAPAFTPRVLYGVRLDVSRAVVVGAIGIGIVGVMWLATLAFVQPVPSVTFVEGQPGGVTVEFAVLAFAGALLGGWRASR